VTAIVFILPSLTSHFHFTQAIIISGKSQRLEIEAVTSTKSQPQQYLHLNILQDGISLSTTLPKASKLLSFRLMKAHGNT